MMTISYRGLERIIKGKILWQIACLTLMWIVWWERNTKDFEYKWRMTETLWDLIHFYSSLCCFQDITLNVV